MLVDVIIPAYNPGPFLDEAIRSALAQTHDEFNIIVVDDNSTEDVEKITKKYKDISYIRNNKNLGPAGSRNIAIKAGSAPYISLLDADDIWHPDKLKRSLAEFKKTPDIGMTCGNYQILVNRQRLLPPFYKRPITIDWSKMMKQNFVASCSTTIRRAVVEQLGGFDESLWISEDMDLWLRISEKFKIKYIHEVLYYYSVIPKGNSLTNRADIQKDHLSNLRMIKDRSMKRMVEGGKIIKENTKPTGD
jgi:glycosyltransferase involved in cell wall biosynthesis